MASGRYETQDARQSRFVSHKDVAKIAYDLFERRGRAHGHDVSDWLKAEALAGGQNGRSPKGFGAFKTGAAAGR